MVNVEAFELEEAGGAPPVSGYLHRPASANGAGVVLAHGAGSNCQAPLLVALGSELASAGYTVLRCNLAFRIARPKGPPRGSGETDRAGLRRAVDAVREIVSGSIYLGGHSYGGRQATMLAAGGGLPVAGLLLLSYPLHPPGKPDQLRTAHFPNLRTPALFVHGARDPFGSIEELEQAVKLIPAPVSLLPVPGAAHDLQPRWRLGEPPLTQQVVAAFANFFSNAARNGRGEMGRTKG